MLVRDGLPLRRRTAIRCQIPWRGPKQASRTVAACSPSPTSTAVRFINVHRTRPGWSHNSEAFTEECERLEEAAARFDGPLVIAGDQNIGTRPGSDRGPNTPWALANDIGGRIVTTTPGRIDYAIVRGVTGRAKQLRLSYGSDHRPVMLTLTAD